MVYAQSGHFLLIKRFGFIFEFVFITKAMIMRYLARHLAMLRLVRREMECIRDEYSQSHLAPYIWSNLDL